MPDAVGVVLAAGSGRRFGMPKALAREDDGRSWTRIACEALADGGCREVVVVLGDMFEEALRLVPDWAHVAVHRGFAAGSGSSLRRGLLAVEPLAAAIVTVTLVDLPHQRPEAVARVAAGAGSDALRRATFGGRVGHPVVIGEDHRPRLAAHLAAGEPARSYLAAHGARGVDCTDLGGGDDVDRCPPGGSVTDPVSGFTAPQRRVPSLGA